MIVNILQHLKQPTNAPLNTFCICGRNVVLAANATILKVELKRIANVYKEGLTISIHMPKAVNTRSTHSLNNSECRGGLKWLLNLHLMASMIHLLHSPRNPQIICTNITLLHTHTGKAKINLLPSASKPVQALVQSVHAPP